MMTSALTSTWSDSSHVVSDIFHDVITTPPPSFTVTPPPTSRSTTDFVYVEYGDYEYSSYEDPSVLSEPPHTATTTTSTTTTTTRKTASPHELQKNSPTMLPATVTMVTADTEGQTPAPVWTSSVPEFSTTSSPDPGDNITSSGGRSLQSKLNLTEAEPAPLPSSSFFPLSKKNNSVDEVQYGIVGLDGDDSRGQQNYFVPRMPPFHERTHNKRIQQLLNEKRRQDLLRRQSPLRASRTDRKH